jgi:hypothetical protein
MKRKYDNSNRARKSLLRKVKIVATADLQSGTTPGQLQKVIDKCVDKEQYEFAQGVHEAIVENYKKQTKKENGK